MSILQIAVGVILVSVGLLPSVAEAQAPPTEVPRAVTVARATTIPRCAVFVDASARTGGDGSAAAPLRTMAAALEAAQPGAVVCVAEGTYREQLKPGDKPIILAGGFQRGTRFTVRDSARYVTKAVGRGGSFLRVDDPAPANALTAVDGFEITGYSQAIVRDFYQSQRFEITNNYIHDNVCADPSLIGAAFLLSNVSGAIRGNVIARNSCGRGGAGALNDALNENTVIVEGNLIEDNAGTEPESAHGGALYLFTNKLTITANLFRRNKVVAWGAGLYVGASIGQGQQTTATLTWNVYIDNMAGIAGGGLFCDDAATCVSSHEIYYRNCGGNIYLDGASDRGAATRARFDHLTNVGALDETCKAPGPGVRIDTGGDASDSYTFTNAIFWGNGEGLDFAAGCDRGCRTIKVVVTHSMVQTTYLNNGVTVTFGPGIIAPADPLFADPAKGDFHLRSALGRWTPAGVVADQVTSPAMAKGDPRSPVSRNPPRAGTRTELGAYGDSGEASFVR